MATSDIVKETLNVSGLSTNVYTRANLRDKRSSEPVVVLFFLHGRTESADLVDPTARAAFPWAAEKEATSREASRDFIVVTFDQRNHGKRTVDQRGNLGWSKKADRHNERHAVDMYSILIGAVKDVSFLIDVLSSYVFPHDERTIGEWVLAGFSLGGHATWLALRNEPRIRIGVPICGCVDYLALMEQRTEKLGIPRTAPYFPESLRALVGVYDPVTPPPGAFVGKRILVLSGADDPLVPWSVSRAFVEALDVGPRGKKEVVVQPGAKHEYTDEMKEELFRFFWEEALVIRQET
ncbi:Alpha/Beta hydrolase protein [Lactarius akahatsu]|uniref:Alpha/Beta hydrolase protein n=1 Tax=Lactarius akahatsu TaxID=416441 RepID=A0AAD4LK06_9AGAM|nr:Alpha/Beta hydrolase protein [Lactarius akahatsu]